MFFLLQNPTKLQYTVHCSLCQVRLNPRRSWCEVILLYLALISQRFDEYCDDTLYCDIFSLSSSLFSFTPSLPPLSVSVCLCVCLSHSNFLAALGRGPFGRRSHSCRSDQFRRTSPSQLDRQKDEGGK